MQEEVECNVIGLIEEAPTKKNLPAEQPNSLLPAEFAAVETEIPAAEATVEKSPPREVGFMAAKL